MNVQRLYELLPTGFRKRRLERFVEAFEPSRDTTILDVGGYPWDWSGGPVQAQFTIANLHDLDLPESEKRAWNYTVADGRDLPFGDGMFDIAFSNSVIEHLSTLESQIAFAQEIRRVGRRLWVQTPARSFPVEPHVLTPFIHYFPKRMQRRLLRFTVWGWVAKPGPAEVERFLDEVRLLSRAEMQRLFPDCRILRERFLGLTKSYIAVR